MQHIRFLLQIVVLGGALVSTVASCAAEPQERPNIVLILADDMGYGDPGIYNPASRVPTPAIDRLAREGMRFTDAHTPSSVCTPTRYGLLTGRYAWRSRLKKGVLYGYDRSLIEPGRPTIASFLKQSGYHTAAIGKWHLGFQDYDPANPEAPVDYSRLLRPGPVSVGFDYYSGTPASLDMDPYVYVLNDRPIAPPTDSVAGSAHRREGGGGFWRGGKASPGFDHHEVLPDLIRKAVAYLEERANAARETPFFLYLPLSAPHTPWLPGEAFRGKSGAGYYGDFAMQVDDAVGQVLEALERLDLAGETLVVYTSDNGAHWLPADIEQFDHRANGDWRGQKADIWEGGHRVPFIVRWPGRVRAGSVSSEPVALTDLFATFAALTGKPLPNGSGEDSESFSAVLLGKPPAEPIHEALVHHSLQGMFAIRKGKWKYIEGLGSGGFTAPARIEPQEGGPEGQLYDLEADPYETMNRYADFPQVVKELKSLLDAYRRQGYSRRAGMN